MFILLVPSSASAAISEFSTGLAPNQGPLQAAAGPNGNVWFTGNVGTGLVGEIGSTGTISTFTTGLLANGGPWGIASGPDGNVWFTEHAAPSIGKMSSAGVVLNQFNGILPVGSSPSGITAGPDGALWFADGGTTGAIGRITTTGTLTEYTFGLAANAKPQQIVTGPDGNLWFTDSGGMGRIGMIVPGSAAITEYSGLSSPPEGIAKGADGNLWFTEPGAPGRIGRITTAGVVTEYSTGLTPNQSPQEIAAGDDGRLYFTESGGTGALGAIALDGTIVEYTAGLTASSAPWGIAAGSDGNIWFTENASPGRLGMLATPPVAVSGAASGITSTAATLAGTIRNHSQASTHYFQYGPTTGYGAQSASTPAGASASTQPISATIGGLAPGTTYHYRLAVTTPAGTGYGQDMTLTTTAGGAPPVGNPPVGNPPVANPPAGNPPAGNPPAGSANPGSAGSGPGGIGSPGADPASRAVLRPGLGATANAVLGQTVIVAPVKGRVLVQAPGQTQFTPVTGRDVVPVGSVVNALHGTVRLLTALDRRGKTQSATFWGGIFEVRQSRTAKGMTDIVLAGGDFGACASTSGGGRHVARATRSRPKSGRPRSHRSIRKLWGLDHNGKYSTHGADSIATVRGTRWLTEDRCDGTLTRVKEGRVLVRDLGSRRSTLVKAGHAHLARPRKAS